MRTHLLVTFTAEDRPGLVEQVSAVVSQHGGNWLESRMIQLAGKFCGIVRVGVDPASATRLSDALGALDAAGFNLQVQTPGAARGSAGEPYELSLLGLDRPGLVHEVSQALAAEGVNVIEMSTRIEAAAMTGEPMFRAQAQVLVPARVDLHHLLDRLDALSLQLAVDIELSPANAA